MGDDCIFCRILSGSIPSYGIFDNGRTFAFMDINPVNPGHALVIHRNHAATIYDIDDSDLAEVAVTARRVARAIREELSPDGLNILQANGPGANQSVFHLHLHVIPRRMGDDPAMNWSPAPGDRAEISAIAERLRTAIKAGL